MEAARTLTYRACRAHLDRRTAAHLRSNWQGTIEPPNRFQFHVFTSTVSDPSSLEPEAPLDRHGSPVVNDLSLLDGCDWMVFVNISQNL